MEKYSIKNRQGLNIAVVVEPAKEAQGLVFIMHGHGGFKEQGQLKVAADVFVGLGITAVRFDTTNTHGESDGNPIDATMTGFLQDLEDVINWASGQSFYKAPFFVVGHSMGGQCVGTYAENNPHKVCGMVFLATSISGKLSAKKYSVADLENWEKTGWRESKSTTRPGLVHRNKWSAMADRMKYDLFDGINKLTMPALVVIGDKDEFIPLEDERLFYESLPGKKEFRVIHGAGHNYNEAGKMDELKSIISAWLSDVGGRRSAIPIVNEQDEVICSKDRSTVTQGDIYRVASLWVTNSKGDVLLARRAYTKSHDPGKWGPAVAGTVEEGESYEANIVKEAEEELGISGVVFTLEPKYLRRGEKYSYFVQPYSVVLDWPLEKFHPRAEEVAEIKWWSKSELARELAETPDEFLKSMHEKLNKFSS